MFKKKVFWLTLLVILVYLVYFIFLKVGIPVVDDYWFFHDFSDIAGKPPGEFFKPLFVVRNSHRLVTTHLTSYLFYFVDGRISPEYMLWAGVFFSLAAFAVLYRFLEKYGKEKWILPLALIYFTPQMFSITFFSLVAVQGILSFFMIFLLGFLLVENKSPFWIIFLAVIITFSNGNGMGIWPAGLAGLMMSRRRSLILPWVIAGIVSVGLYFVNYQNTGLVTQPKIGISYIGKVLVFILGFIGNGFDFFPLYYFSDFSHFALSEKGIFLLRVFLIFLIPLLFLWVAGKRLFRNFNGFTASPVNRFVTIVMVFVVFSAFMAGVFRAEFGFGLALSYRYKHYGVLSCMMLVLLLAENTKKTTWLSYVSLLYFVLSYWVFYPFAKDFNLELISGNMNLKTSGETVIHRSYGEEINREINEVLIPDMIKGRVYSLEDGLEAARIRDLSSSEIVALNPAGLSFSDKLFNNYLVRTRSEKGEEVYLPVNLTVGANRGLFNRNLYTAKDDLDSTGKIRSAELYRVVKK